MYLPAHFAQSDIPALHALMREHPFATLVMQTAAGIDANHLPLLLDAEPAPTGTLRGHVARANPLWRDVAAGKGVLAIFHGPEAYVTPQWYPSKAETGKVVPTWNYAVVHAHGTLRVIDDAVWLRALLDDLTARHEAVFATPWRPADAPPDYIDNLIQAVVGIEIGITRLVGKWKVGQNQPERNRAGVAAGLRQEGGAASEAMADLVDETNKLRQ